MKRKIIAAILFVVLIMCATGCSGLTAPPKTETVYERLDKFAKEEYRQIELVVITETEDVRLTSNYVLTKSNVKYSVERLNTFPTSVELDGVTAEYKTTLTGEAEIVDGKVNKLDGEGVSIPSYDELKGNFSFTESNFKNVTTKDGFLSADVVSPSMFYGATVDVQEMKVSIEYTEAALSKIVITYKTPNSTVTTTYEFTA